MQLPAVPVAFLLDDIVCATLDDGCGGYDNESCLLLELLDGGRTAGAHRSFYFREGSLDAVLEGTCVRYIGVDAFLESHLTALAAVIVTLPVPCTVGTFAPVLLDVCAAYQELPRRGLVESREIPSEHHEVCAHGKCECHVVIVYDTAVGAQRDVYACLLEVLISLGSNCEDSRSLAAADTLLLTGDADGTAADTDLDEVCAAVCK